MTGVWDTLAQGIKHMRESKGRKISLEKGSDHGGVEHHGKECDLYSINHSEA